MKRLVLSIFFCVTIAGCESERDADVGYDDGYAVGYNSTCKIRATLIEGDWDNKRYAEAYRGGYADGSAQCLADGGPEGWNK